MRARRVAGWLVLTSLACGCTARGGPGGTNDPTSRVVADVNRRAGLTSLESGPEAEAAVRTLLAQPLTEEAAVKVALLSNPEVRATYERLGIACADLLQAGLLKNPVFSMDAKFFSAGPEIELALAQSFVDLFFRPLRRRVAAADLRAEEAAVARALVSLAYDVKRAFVRVHASEAVVALASAALERAQASRDLMRQLHAAGNALDTVRTVEEAEATRAELDVQAARLKASEARESLGLLLALRDEGLSWTLAGSLGEPAAAPESGGLADRAQQVSLDLLESRARIDAALCQAGLTRKEGVLPELEGLVVGKRESPDGPWGFGPGFSTALPIFDHGQAKLVAAHAVLRQQVAHHEGLILEVRSAARRLSTRLSVLRERLRLLREVYLPLREQLVRETLQSFNAMQIGAFEVLHAKRAELDARREHAQTLREVWLASLDLSELLAGSLNRARLETPDLPEEAQHPQAPKGH